MSTKAEALQRLLNEVRDRIGGSAPKWPSQVLGTLDEMGALRLDTDDEYQKGYDAGFADGYNDGRTDRLGPDDLISDLRMEDENA